MELSMFKWYRRKCGGIWYKVRPIPMYGIYGTYWINREPLNNEIPLECEVYGVRNVLQRVERR